MKESSEIMIVMAMCMVFFLTLILAVWFVTNPQPKFGLSDCQPFMLFGHATSIQLCEITR